MTGSLYSFTYNLIAIIVCLPVLGTRGGHQLLVVVEPVFSSVLGTLQYARWRETQLR